MHMIHHIPPRIPKTCLFQMFTLYGQQNVTKKIAPSLRTASHKGQKETVLKLKPTSGGFGLGSCWSPFSTGWRRKLPSLVRKGWAALAGYVSGALGRFCWVSEGRVDLFFLIFVLLTLRNWMLLYDMFFHKMYSWFIVMCLHNSKMGSTLLDPFILFPLCFVPTCGPCCQDFMSDWPMTNHDRPCPFIPLWSTDQSGIGKKSLNGEESKLLAVLAMRMAGLVGWATGSLSQPTGQKILGKLQIWNYSRKCVSFLLLCACTWYVYIHIHLIWSYMCFGDLQHEAVCFGPFNGNSSFGPWTSRRMLGLTSSSATHRTRCWDVRFTVDATGPLAWRLRRNDCFFWKNGWSLKKNMEKKWYL